jgi:type II secretory pathway pseudopilin PulG
MPRISLLLLLALIALLVSASTAGANTQHDRAVLKRERIAVKLINKATQRVRRDHRNCRPSFRPDSRPTFTDARPSDALLKALGVLRRPATDADRLDPSALIFPFARNIYENWIRVATAVDGHQFFVVVAQDRMRFPPPPRHCIALENEELDRLLRDRDATVQRVAHRLKARLDRTEHPKGGFKPNEAIFLFDRTADGRLGGGGGGVDLRRFLRHGLFGSSGTGTRSTVSGLLPDGVASVEFTFDRSVSRGPHREPKRYPKAIALTVPVQDNVVAFDVDRPAPDAFPTRMVWRRADGSVLRRIGRGSGINVS